MMEEGVMEEDGGFVMSNAHQDSNRYHKEMKKLIEACDIILEILDARDPLSCRCKNI